MLYTRPPQEIDFRSKKYKLQIRTDNPKEADQIYNNLRKDNFVRRKMEYGYHLVYAAQRMQISAM
jgi:hypothetical protein